MESALTKRNAGITIIALLFFVLASGVFLPRSGRKWLDIALAVVNLPVANVAIQDEPLARGAPWVVIPAAMMCYFMSTAGGWPQASSAIRKNSAKYY